MGKVKPFMKKSLEMLAQKLELESEPLAKKDFFYNRTTKSC